LINTKFELSMPGFMSIDFVNQIRKEEKIGGGGAAVIYKGIILDQKLIEVFFLFLSFFSLETKDLFSFILKKRNLISKILQ